MEMRKWEIKGGKRWRHMIFHGLDSTFVVFKRCDVATFMLFRIPISHSYTKSPRMHDHFDILILIINIVLAIFSLISIIFSSTMVRLIEETHYTRRESQPSPAPLK